MFIPDGPDVPPKNVPVLIVQAKQAQPSNVRAERIVGICHIVANEPFVAQSAENILSPIVGAQDYLDLYEHRTLTDSAIVSVLQQPKHGTLAGGGDGNYAYFPEKGYRAKDSAAVLVDIGGTKVKVVYFFQMIGGSTVPEDLAKKLCKKGYSWKISSAVGLNGNSPITSVKYQSFTTSASGNTGIDSPA
jgi:hypothetical protein